MDALKFDAVVIGAGPGGYVAGIRLAQLGKHVAIVEKGEVGGVCLNVGCIPSKALIQAAKLFDKVRHAESMGLMVDGVHLDMPRLQAWKQQVVDKLTSGVRQLIKGAGATLIAGEATIVGPHELEVKTPGETLRLESTAIVVATGSRSIPIPGFPIDNERILDSTSALSLASIPSRLLVIGGGYIGLELGMLYAKLGSKVTVVEFTPGLLPGTDAELSSVVARKMRKLGIDVHLETRAKSYKEVAGGLQVLVEKQGKDAGEKEILCDKVLVTVGRKPYAGGLGLEAVGVAIDARGFVVVDRQMRSSVPSIYAIGDVAGQPMLAHKASKEAEVVAEVIAGKAVEMDARAIPEVVFTDPEIASVGLTQAEAEKTGRKVKVGKYPFAALGRALAQQETEGFVKVIADENTNELLGLHIVGPGASDLISEGALALEMGANLSDIALTIHPHPTLGEAVMEAAKAALGESPHLLGGGKH